MDNLLTVIVVWLVMNVGLPADYHHPSVEFVSQAEASLARYGVAGVGDELGIVAVYDSTRDVILLLQDWSPESLADVSILVHEMVHHLQARAGVAYPCEEAREALAYAAQEMWLNQYGTNLSREFGIDDFTVKIRTTCPVP